MTQMRQMTVAGGLGRQTLSVQAVGSQGQDRYNASRSLELVRLNIQTLVNKDIDCLLRKYLDKFYKPALANIRKNLGEGSINEEDIRVVCIRMLEDAKSQYNQLSPYHSMARQRVQSSANVLWKKKDSDPDQEQSKVRKKALRTVTSILPGTPTPIRLVKLEGVRREGPKWDPARITRSTLFIMGARANKVLGFGQTRGRLYTKHPTLLKYSGDTEDKEWLSRSNLMPPTGGIAYLLLLEDIRELAESSEYRHNPNVLMHELKGFYAPDFMLEKIRRFIAQARTEGKDDCPLQTQDGLIQCGITELAQMPVAAPLPINHPPGPSTDNIPLLPDSFMYSMLTPVPSATPVYSNTCEFISPNGYTHNTNMVQ